MKFKKEKVVLRDAGNSIQLPGAIFNEIKRAGQLRACFPYDRKMHNIDFFLEAMEKYYHLYAVYYSNVLCGAVWITGWEHRSARIAFAAFKTNARFYFYEIMNEAATQLINVKDPSGRYCYDSLYGLIAENNKRIIRASRLCGFKNTGFIPNLYGERKNAVILSFTR